MKTSLVILNSILCLLFLSISNLCAQSSMVIRWQENTSVDYSLSSIRKITFEGNSTSDKDISLFATAYKPIPIIRYIPEEAFPERMISTDYI